MSLSGGQPSLLRVFACTAADEFRLQSSSSIHAGCHPTDPWAAAWQSLCLCFAAYLLMHMQGQPLYPSKSVRFHFASSLQQLEGATGENSSSCTAEYPVENSDSLQRFIIPPMLCIGGFVRVSVVITSFSLLHLFVTCQTAQPCVYGQHPVNQSLRPVCGGHAMLCSGCMPHERSATAYTM